MILNPYRFAAGGGGGGSDPYWASVLSVLNFETDFTDEKGLVWTPTGNMSVSGGEAISDGAGDYLSTSSGALVLGSGDYTVELFITLPVLPNAQRGVCGISTGTYWFCGISGENKFFFSCGATLLAASPLVAGQRYHVAVVRLGTKTTLYIGGVRQLDTTTAPSQANFTTPLQFLAAYDAGSSLNCRLAGFRVTLAARYTADFTPPAAPFA